MTPGVRTLAFCFAAGLVLRLAIATCTSDLGPKISDELQYSELASSLVQGRGFAWASGEPTSLRPPLYPGLIASVWLITGEGHYQAIRLLQIVLSLLTAMVVYALGREAFGESPGRLAAIVTWLYPSLVFANTTILTETLFTALLVTFVWLAVRIVQAPDSRRPASGAEFPAPGVALLCGLTLGLGALTRSVLWPVPIVLCPLLALLLWRAPTRARTLREGRYRFLVLPALVFAGYAVAVGPWAVRNTRLQKVPTVVDTMGGMNLRMGNYEHTPEDRIWDAVSLHGEKNWVYALTQEPPGPPPPGGVFTEGMKDKWAQRKALEYMRAHPGTTLRRAAIKFADFWGLERSFVAGVQQGLYNPPRWFAVMAAAAIVVSYIVLACLGAAGFWLAPTDSRTRTVVLLPVLFICGVHAIVFGHERYHLPLVPLLALMGAALWHAGFRRSAATRPVAAAGALFSIGLLAAIWARQLLVTDAARLRTLFERFL